METLAKIFIIGWDSRWVFQPAASLVTIWTNLGKYTSLLDEIACVAVGLIAAYLMFKALVYQYKYITLPEIRNMRAR
jgi:hypothetical protein